MTHEFHEIGPDMFVSAIHTASRALAALSARSLAEVDDSVTPAQFRVLVVLSRGTHNSLAALTDELHVNASTVMRSANRLIATGLVFRWDYPSNHREVVLGLTSAGKELVDKVVRRRRQEIARIMGPIPASLFRVFDSLAGVTDETPSIGW